MIKFAVIAMLCLVSAATLFRPWVGALSYIVLAIWAPQTIWFWGFDGIRASLILSAVIGISFLLHLYMGNISLSAWKTKQNAVVLFLWIMILCSYYFGAFPPNDLDAGSMNSSSLVTRYSKIFFMFFLLQALIRDEKIISRILWALVFVFGFYTYWANYQYLSGEMFQRYTELRLGGPTPPDGSGNYSDQNGFAMLFVMAVPLFFFLAQENKSKFMKGILYLLIPFAWHSVFLTGSRGGLVGLAVITLHIVYRSRSKIIGILIVLGLIIAFIDQGGDLLRQRSTTIIHYKGESSAMERIEAWEKGSQMVMDHPIFGVGLGNFTVAWKEFDKSSVTRVAHSSVVQFAAETGIFAALAYLLIFVTAAMDLREIRKAGATISVSDAEQASRIISIANALEGACLGFFVCGLFLSLGASEIFYTFIMLIILLKWHSVGASSGLAGNSPPINDRLLLQEYTMQ